MRHVSLVAAIVAATLVACSDDSTPAADAPSMTPSVVPVTVDAVSYEYATGPDDVVISVAYEGGFVPRELLFTRTPAAMVTGDGRSLTTGPVAEIFPGPLLPNVLERPITPEATVQLLALADELGLLADVTYPRNDVIADAPDTVVTITVGGTTYRHQADALGIDTEADVARVALGEFVTAMTDLPGTVGDDELGVEEPYVAQRYLIQAIPVDPDTLSVDVEPTIEAWPEDAAVRPVDADVCAEVPVAEFEPLFAGATTLTFYTDADVTYQISAVPELPGRSC